VGSLDYKISNPEPRDSENPSGIASFPGYCMRVDGDMVSVSWSAVSTTLVLSALFAASTAQQRFQFCGGPSLIHAVIRVCSRSLPDELAPPTEPPTTTGKTRHSGNRGWRRGPVVSGVRRVNEVNARRARLVLVWVFGRVYHLGM